MSGGGGSSERWTPGDGRNRRSVWTIVPSKERGFAATHFAVMPQALVEPCIKAGSRPYDLVLDPFAGAGTVLLEASRHKRNSIGIELNPENVEICENRIRAWENTDESRQWALEGM